MRLSQLLPRDILFGICLGGVYTRSALLIRHENLNLGPEHQFACHIHPLEPALLDKLVGPLLRHPLDASRLHLRNSVLENLSISEMHYE
jgi:hypothetical protein